MVHTSMLDGGPLHSSALSSMPLEVRQTQASAIGLQQRTLFAHKRQVLAALYSIPPRICLPPSERISRLVGALGPAKGILGMAMPQCSTGGYAEHLHSTLNLRCCCCSRTHFARSGRARI